MLARHLRETMLVILKLGGPVLLAALAVGVVMSLVQAVTQINEATLAFVPKFAGDYRRCWRLSGPFMLATTHRLYANPDRPDGRGRRAVIGIDRPCPRCQPGHSVSCWCCVAVRATAVMLLPGVGEAEVRLRFSGRA